MKNYTQSKLNRVKRGAKRATYDVEMINTILDAGFIGFVNFIYQNKAISLPMAYGRKGNAVYLHGSQANRMLTSLVNVGEMSMTVMHLDALVLARSGFHHSVNYRSATLFGSVQRIDESNEKEQGIKCIMDHMMPNRWENVRPMNEQEFNRTLVVKMLIETASAKIRDVGVQDDPDDYDTDYWAGLVPIKQIALTPIADDKLAKKIAVPQHIMEYVEFNGIDI